MRLIASSISLARESGVATLGFNADDREPGNYILLQRDLNPQQADRDLGHDRPYVEIGEQMCSAYGAVREGVIRGGSLVLALDPRIATALGIDEAIEIVFASDHVRRDEVVEQLRVILGAEHVRVADS